MSSGPKPGWKPSWLQNEMRLPKALFCPALSISKHGDSVASLDDLFWCSATPMRRILSLPSFKTQVRQDLFPDFRQSPCVSWTLHSLGFLKFRLVCTCLETNFDFLELGMLSCWAIPEKGWEQSFCSFFKNVMIFFFLIVLVVFCLFVCCCCFPNKNSIAISCLVWFVCLFIGLFLLWYLIRKCTWFCLNVGNRKKSLSL